MNYLRALQLSRTLSADADGSGGVTPPAATPELKTFSEDFVKELRAEARSYRLKLNEYEKSATEAKAAAEKSATELAGLAAKSAKELEAKVAEVSTAAAARLVRAEIKSGAVAAGIAHVNFIKLLDTSAIKIGEDGEVAVPEGFWTEAKTKFAHLFTATGADKGTTSQTKTPPKPGAPAAKHVSEMTDAEADAALSALMKSGR